MNDPTTSQILGALSTPAPTDPFSITRRRFLQGAAAVGAVSALPYWLSDEAIAGPPIGATDGVLVLITMGGGNDGLNTVIPINDGAYFDARPNLAIPAQTALVLDNDRALHPNLTSIKEMWDAGNVAIIDGVSQPTDDLSHFTSMGRWMSAVINGAPTSGWLGRYLDELPGTDPLGAVTIGSSVPLLLQGRRRMATALPESVNGLFRIRDDGPSRDIATAVTAFGGSAAGRSDLEVVLGDAGQAAINLAADVLPGYADPPAEGKLARQLQIAARLINANLGIRVLHVIYGDFDSHSGQPGQHGARMAELNEGVDVFFDTLATTWESRTMLVTASEFGRRVASNDSQGTDHGAASTLFAIGRNVNSGYHGALPSLTDLTREGNLKMEVDFRSVYATLLDTWLKADSNRILGASMEKVDFLAAPGDGATPTTTTTTIATTVPPPTEVPATTVPPTTGTTTSIPKPPVESTTPSSMATTVTTAMATTVASTAPSSTTSSSSTTGSTIATPPTTAPRESTTTTAAETTTTAAETTTTTQAETTSSTPAETTTTTASENALPTAVPRPPSDEDPEDFDPGDPDTISMRGRRRQNARMFLAFFGRLPTDKEAEFWVTRRGRGVRRREMADVLAQSEEFQKRTGSLDDTEFVQMAFRTIIGRRPRRSELRHWSRQMVRRNKGRGWLVLRFSQSAEFRQRVRDIVRDYVRARPIARLYLAYFGEGPSEEQLTRLVDARRRLTRLSREFAQSESFEKQYGHLGGEAFVEAACTRLLERTCTKAETTYWTGLLGDGDSGRELVMAGLSESQEFVERSLGA